MFSNEENASRGKGVWSKKGVVQDPAFCPSHLSQAGAIIINHHLFVNLLSFINIGWGRKNKKHGVQRKRPTSPCFCSRTLPRSHDL